MPNEDLERCVRMVLAAGLSTGHADTHADLIDEVLDQYRELSDKLRKCENDLLDRVEHS